MLDWSDHLILTLNLTVITGPTRTLKIQGFDHKLQNFSSDQGGVVGPAPSALH